MGLDTATVGSNQREIGIIGDPVAAANQLNVGQFHNSDGQTLGGSLYSLLVGAVKLLWNGTNFTRAVCTPGANGVQAVATESIKFTYSAAKHAFVPVASATDIFGVIGSGSKTVRITRISISGVAGTAITVDVSLFQRTAANSGSTPVAITSQTHDLNDTGATATVTSYTTTNPTLGAGVEMRTAKLNLALTGASADKVVWEFGTRNSKGLVLRGVAQGLFLNLNGASPSSPLVDVDVEWTEE